MSTATQPLSALYDPLVYETAPPLALIDELRAQHSVVWVDEKALPDWPGGNGFWLVLRHAEVSSVLKQPKLYSSAAGATQLRDPATPTDLAYVQQMMLNMDPPVHSRLRRLLQNSFTSRAVAGLEQSIAGHARSIVDRIIAGQTSGECDFARDIAADMPLLCLADLFGMPAEDRYLLFDWANRVIGFQDPEYAVSASFDPSSGSDIAREALKLRPAPDQQGRMPDPRTRSGMPDLYHYAHLLARHKRGHPGDDIMSLLLAQVDEDGGSVSIAEFENLFWLFAVAGNETVRNGIPGGMIALLQNPQALRDLQADLSRLPRAVDEMLRWWTPVMIFRRTATTDTRLADVTIKKGDKVVVSFLSANRDERLFDDPQQFNINRHPNAHLTFGYGPHFCLGAQLARAQMNALFSEVLGRFASIEANGEPGFLRSNFQRGVKTLPIRWTTR